MTLRLRITVRAADEIERASLWWQENRPAAPYAVHEDLERTLRILAVQPGIGQRVANARLNGVRRIHIDRVHHHVYYRVQPGELIVLRFWPSQRLKQPSV
ncbi:type II toxin-antitoxin system RelE/ParE family toxin [Roseateles sp.]|uniref:type II toxin-antitoxin system RelE/ParE family toxin n=1 Tax=Roseateles sp. TaxID=1971397 RepID=UPI002DFB35D0|nr:type II toxin-antitoxin system RelE/ParE family toxin [Roseateles sp.]